MVKQPGGRSLQSPATALHQIEWSFVPNTRYLTDIPRWPSLLSLAISQLTVRASDKYTEEHGNLHKKRRSTRFGTIRDVNIDH